MTLCRSLAITLFSNPQGSEVRSAGYENNLKGHYVTYAKVNGPVDVNNEKQLSVPKYSKIYLAQIQSHLNYGLILWGNMANHESLNKIRTIQNKSMKMIQPYCRTHQTYRDLKLLDLTKLIELENKNWAIKFTINYCLLVCLT